MNKKILKFYDLFFTYFAPVGYILTQYIIRPAYSWKWKLLIGGIILIGAFLIKGLIEFGKGLNQKMLTATNEIARSTDNAVKEKWGIKYDKLAFIKAIWNRLGFVLPLAITLGLVFFVQKTGAKLSNELIIIIVSVIIGSVFSILNAIKREV